MKMRVMYRHIQEVPVKLWEQKLEQERMSDEAEAKAGHPLPIRLRQMFGPSNSHIRVSERIYDSFADFARLLEESQENDELQKLEARRRKFFNWEREELYYIDTGSPIPAWMKYSSVDAKKGKEYTKDELYNQEYSPLPDITAGIDTPVDFRVMYRHIQEVPVELWEKKIEQERISDELESQFGFVIPLRYRQMFGPEHSHIRVDERICDLVELMSLYADSFKDEKMQRLEARRLEFFTWEREELYYVDTGNTAPLWMKFVQDLEKNEEILKKLRTK